MSQTPRVVSSPSATNHRHNLSMSSVHSSGSATRGSSERRSGKSGVESAVTRLLIAIRQLLESLTLWSNETVTETNVSDVYVRLGNDFNSAVAAFTSFNIDMSDLMSVPNDLRTVLENCLAEDATPANLEIYLPQVRQIITNLLQGLRVKQSSYRRITERRSSKREDSTRYSDDSRGRKPSNAGFPESTAEESAKETNERNVSKVPLRDDSLAGPSGLELPESADGRWLSGFAAPSSSKNVNGESSQRRSSANRDSSQSSSPNGKPALSSTKSYGPVASPPMNNGDDSLRRGKSVPFQRTSDERRATPPPIPPALSNQQFAPPTMTRYSLTDAPVAPDPDSSPPAPPAPPVVIQPTIDSALSRLAELDNESTVEIPHTQITPAPDTPPLESSQAPEVANSLRALKKSDTLERRASKRFSTYNFQKMTGSKISPSASIVRRSIIAGSGALTPGDLATLTEETEESPARSAGRSPKSKSTERRARGPSPVISDTPPPVPPVPVIDPSVTADSSQKIDGLPSTVPDLSARSSIQAFMQVGRDVKKVTLEPGLTVATLRILFMDKFAYNPGQDNFPAIYIRDPLSGVQYELEDVEEVKEKCLLSLNIEPLDQIKQHIDTQMMILARDLKELKVQLSSQHRVSVQQFPAAVALQAPPSPVATPSRPTDKQLRDAARRLSRIHSDDSQSTQLRMPAVLEPQGTGGSVATIPESTSLRIVSDLKTQFDEVQNLRRDIGVMRQLYTQFMTQTKESLGDLRSQAGSLRQTANTKVGGARAFIDGGKDRIDSRSQNVLTKVEELQDTVENLKDDVLKRQVSPKRAVLKNLKDDIDLSSAELESLRDQLKNVKPVWKKTWEEELQNIVEEQQFLQHQEEFVEDLVEDHKALAEVYAHLEKVVNLRGSGSLGRQGLRAFRPPLQEEGHDNINTVMLQIRGAAVDQEKRMRAIEQNQKAREKEKAGRADEFEDELAGFVKGKKLKMTGGAEEAERVRQKKSEATLKAMFVGEG